MQTLDLDRICFENTDRVLDVGCGEGRLSLHTYSHADVLAVGVDMCLKDLQTAQSRFSEFEEPNNPDKHFGLSQTNAYHLPFADHTFDKVFCSEVLEHLHEYPKALAEIERVLKPGGVFVASVPRFWPEKICWWLSTPYHEVEGGHVRIFKEQELQQAIEKFGFRRFDKHWAHSLHSPYWWLKCLFWNNQENNWLIKQYHRFLVWDLMQKPMLTKILDVLLNPLMGKSVVLYFRKGLQP
ncbi:MAG: class I SAM-dependent methyltransferase [Pseudomonadales bacterium]|nr:class I SAM-dependent methyltransferase [Pseudomonadales bacterium]